MTNAKNVTPAKTYQSLDRILLANAPSLLKEWTGRDVEIKESECLFINTARDDGNLGSCSVNLKTGAFNDHADPTFHGVGLIRIYARLKSVDEHVSFERLQNLQRAHPKGAADLRQTRAPQSKAKKAATVTEPAPIHGAGAVEPMDMHPQLGLVSKSWEYKTADGKSVAFVVCRFDLEDGKKDTRPQAWSKNDQEWIWQFPTGTLPVYNLDAITSRVDATILVNEGEKATEAAQRQFPDMVATTSAKGANNAHSADWSVLANREVIICPDADEAGTGYALAVIGQAVVHGATGIRVKDTLQIGWESGDDLADHDVTNTFLDDAQSYDQIYKIKQYESDVVKAAAELPDGELDRQIDRLSKLLGITKPTFKSLVKKIRSQTTPHVEELDSELVAADPEPWDDEVDGLVLFTDIRQLINRHVVLTPEQLTAVATWIFYSYCFDHMRVSPMLLLTSATKRCGKSTLMEVCSGLVSRPLPVANISAAAIYRVIEAARPTLLIDEADTFLTTNDEVAGILNSGHTKQMAYVVRIEKDSKGRMTPKKFSSFCPKVVGMIGLPKSGALLDRCVMVRLERAAQGVSIQAMPPDVDEAFLDYRRKLSRWAQDNVDELALDFKLLPRGTHDRSQNNWSVLASTAKVIHLNVLQEVETAYLALGGEADEAAEDVAENLLAALFEIALRQVKPEGMQQIVETPHETLPNNKGMLASEHLIVALNEMKHEPWGDYNSGKGLTANKLGRVLSRFNIKSKQARVDVHTNPKRGYRIAELIPIWGRYGIGLDVLTTNVEEKNES